MKTAEIRNEIAMEIDAKDSIQVKEQNKRCLRIHYRNNRVRIKIDDQGDEFYLKLAMPDEAKNTLYV